MNNLVGSLPHFGRGLAPTKYLIINEKSSGGLPHFRRGLWPTKYLNNNTKETKEESSRVNSRGRGKATI